MIDMLQVRGARLWQHPCFDGRHDPLHLSLGEEHLPLALDVSNVAARQDVWRQLGPQTAITLKYDDGMHAFGRDSGQVRERPDVTFVLMQGILKLELVSSVCLCPKGMGVTPEYPSAHVFGLDDEHAVAGDDHMIDLRRASTSSYRYVVYVNVIGRRKKELRRNNGLEFAEPARELRTQRHFDRYSPDERLELRKS